MNNVRRVLASMLLIPALLLLQGCDRDGVVGVGDEEGPDPVNLLVAERVSAPPTIDGVRDDAAWATAQPALFSVVVADIPSFAGYGGRRHQVEMRALYDDNNVYLLAQYNDASLDTDRETWYVDGDEWKHESRWPTIDDDGNVTRRAYYEDKFSLMWEASPVAGFAELGCGVACHVGLSPVQNAAGKSALKYTNNFGEVMDMWHLKYVRNGGGGAFVATMDDQYTDWTSTAGNGGRHSDPGTNSYVNNSATVDGFTVPKYAIPVPTDTYYWITADQISSGEAQEVVGVDAGSLVLANGARIEASDPDYQRDGQFNLPSVHVRLVDGDRADIESRMVFDGKLMTVEISRALITGSEYDVQFGDKTKDYPFGVGVFDNAAIAHATSNVYFLRFN